MKKIDDENILTIINNRVASMLSRILFVKIDYTPRYTTDSDKSLYKDVNGYYEIINLDHGMTKSDYMGKDINAVTDNIVKDCIINYALLIVEPERHKFLPSYKVGFTDWKTINTFIAQCYKYIYPDEKPPVLPIQGICENGSY